MLTDRCGVPSGSLEGRYWYFTLRFFYMAREPLVGQGPLTVEASLSQLETRHWQDSSVQVIGPTQIFLPGVIISRNPSKREDADLRLGPRGHRDRPKLAN